MTTWRQARRSSEQRAKERMLAGALHAEQPGEKEMPAKMV
jgi:hypothetical protein